MQKIGRWVDKRLKWFFTVPTIIFVLAMVLFPIIYTLVLSFHSWRMSANIPWEYVGLQNYIDLFSDSRFPWLSAVPLFHRYRSDNRNDFGNRYRAVLEPPVLRQNFVKQLYLIPMVATPVAIGMVWKLMYDPNIGILDYILKSMGMPTVNFLGDSNIALYSLIVVDIWEWTPQVMLIVLAGITSISTEPFESAMVDGATPWQVTWHITLPLLRPTIFTAFLLRLIDVLKTFDIMYSMTQGGPGYATETMNILSYRQAFEFMQFGSASSMLIVFFVVVMVIAAITVKIKSKMEVDY